MVVAIGIFFLFKGRVLPYDEEGSCRGLATGELQIRDIFRVLSKEIRIALCVGLAMGILASLRAVLTTHDPQLIGPLSLTVGLAMLGCVVLAISAGALSPSSSSGSVWIQPSCLAPLLAA